MKKVKERNIHMLDKVFITLGSLLILYYLALKVTIGFVSFSSMFLLLGIMLLVYGVIEVRLKINLWLIVPKSIRKIIIVVFSICLSIFIVIEGLIIYNGNHYDKEKPDYLMVLGAGIRGTTISLSLKDRLDTVLEYNRMYPEIPIIVSGGQGKGEDISEALAMKTYLVSHGIDENLIISEDKSTTTYENFMFTKNLLDDKTGKENYKITVISNGFHMYRAKFLAKEIGFEVLGYPAPSRPSTAIIFYVREFFGVIKAYVFGF